MGSRGDAVEVGRTPPLVCSILTHRPGATVPRPDVKLINVIAHVLAETNQHAGHADILREQLDGATGFDSEHAGSSPDAAWWRGYVATIEDAARKASS